MPITFENDNNVIVYALDKIISYAKNNQYIFSAQSVWWIASTVGLTEGLVIYIDNLRIRSEVRQGTMESNERLSWASEASPEATNRSDRAVSITP